MLDASQKQVLRALITPSADRFTIDVLRTLGFPTEERALRRLAGIARKIPEGPHAPIFDRWMTFVEGGEGSPVDLCKGLAKEVALPDAMRAIELLYYAEQDAGVDASAFSITMLPGATTPPLGEKPFQEPGSETHFYRSTVDPCVRAYVELLQREGYQTWSHGHDGSDDLNQGDVVAWKDGVEIAAAFDQKGDVVEVGFEWNRTLVRTFTKALVDLHGAEKVLAELRKCTKLDMRGAIGMVRAAWAIADHTGSEEDPIADALAWRTGCNRHYIYWTARAHVERLRGARREALVLRFVGKENSDQVFGWLRFATSPAINDAARVMVRRTFNISYYDLEQAESAADRFMPYLDASLLPVLKKAVANDSNPTMQTILLGRMGELAVVKTALESEYPMARAAAKKALAAARGSVSPSRDRSPRK